MARKIKEGRFCQVAQLTAKLIERLKPYVEAHTRGEDIHATSEFVDMIKREAEDLKKESFGAELLYTIGNIYKEKALPFVMSREGLRFQAFILRWKQGGGISSGLEWNVMTYQDDALKALKHMRKLEAKGTLEAVEHQALTKEVVNKILFASWYTSALDITLVLQKVLDNVLKDSLHPEVLYDRGKAILLIGEIFISMSESSNESDKESQILERIGSRFKT